ncbi:MAG: hypothetical protein K2Q22_01685, partial [Cytophagales bacterium]|nr:hypothetical protein [Cytophagales bacterium]
STGNIDYYVIYGHASAGAGFDILLKDYGSDTRCKGQSTPVGMNGFYAKGQLYAYLDLLVGVKVPLIGSELKVTVLEGQAASLMQIHGPNPTWVYGAIACQVNVMDLIKGRFDFVMEMGEKCQVVGAPPIAKVAVISECSPEKNATRINVFTTPQATFNLPINQSFEMLDEEDRKQAYRVAFDYFKVTTPSGKELDGRLEWNAEKKVAVFNPTDVLPGLTNNMKLDAKVHFEQKKDGRWQDVMYKGARIEESYSSTFSTADEPDYIPKSNIAYSYPLVNQFNFYKDEYGKGYIKLKQGQTKPFQLEPGFGLGGRFVSSNSASVSFGFTYNNSNKWIEFDIPKETKTNTVYELQLLRLPTQANRAIDANVSNTTS